LLDIVMTTKPPNGANLMRSLIAKHHNPHAPFGEGEVEVGIVESCHADDASAASFTSFTLRSISVLVRFPAERSRPALAGLAHVLMTASVTTQTLAVGDCAERLRALLSETAVDSVSIVFHVEPGAVAPSRFIDDVAEACRAAASTLAVVVAESWQVPPSRGIDGFVRGATATSLMTAINTFLLLEALNAPDTLTCLDREDVAACLGTHDAPAVLCVGAWSSGLGELLFASPADASALTTCDALTVNVLASMDRRDLVALVNRIRSLTLSKCVTYQAPLNWIASPLGSNGIVPVSILCRPTTLGMVESNLEPVAATIPPC
jgi:hypothetical protein